MTTDLIVPMTGEVVALDGPTDQLAEAIAEIKDLEGELRAAKNTIGEELLKRMDNELKWSVEAGIYKVTGQSPDVVKYNTEKIIDLLNELRKEGQITERMLTQVLDMKPVLKKSGINRLLKMPRIKERVEACVDDYQPERRVTVNVAH